MGKDQTKMDALIDHYKGLEKLMSDNEVLPHFYHQIQEEGLKLLQYQIELEERAKKVMAKGRKITNL